jgi:predicted NAD/FAD-dependent oxidoreductase
MNSTAIIGAGLAGLTIARALIAAGRAVTMFDKGRKPGGRLATRRTGGFTFNHGCQFASPRDANFRALLEQTGAQPWPQAGPHRLSGVPDMASIAANLAQNLTIHQSTRITAIQQTPDGWALAHGVTTQNFATLILAIPAPQAAELLPNHKFKTALNSVHLAPCWAVMLGYHEAVSGPDLLRPAQNPLAWIARETSRPGNQNSAAAYTLHATPAWSNANLEAPPETIIATLTAAFAALTGVTTPPAYAAAHRWRFALADRPLGQPCLWDPESRLGLAGDWCLDGRLEAAYLSGSHLAELILA